MSESRDKAIYEDTNSSNGLSIDQKSVSDEGDESIYEEPYSTNIYDVYENLRPRKTILICLRKWWLPFLFLGLVIGTLVVGLSIYCIKLPVMSSPTTSTAFLTLVPTTAATTGRFAVTTTPISLSPTTMTTMEPAVSRAVLLLSTHSSANKPIVVGLNGELVFLFIVTYHIL